MGGSRGHELSPDKARVYRTARRMEWLTIAYMLSAVVLLYLTLGSSQAMKAAWWEDLLGLLPPAAFLLADRFRDRDPDPRFPYGYHRATSLAYLSAALAWSAVPSVLLGRAKLPLAAQLHDKVLGHVFVGEAFVVPADDADPLARIEEAARRLRAADWRVQEIVVTLVGQLDPGEAAAERG